MDWPDWNTLSFAALKHLPVLLVCAGMLAVGALVLGRRHGRSTRLVAGGIRLCALLALGLVLLSPVVTTHSEARFEPYGLWQAQLPDFHPYTRYQSGLREPSEQPEGFQIFSDYPDQFVARVRNALAEGNPPAAVEVLSVYRDEALATRDAIVALGIPCSAAGWYELPQYDRPVLTTIAALRSVSPGEPMLARFRVAGTGGELAVMFDGELVELTDNTLEIRSQEPGRHVLEAFLTDDHGRFLQGAGHVFRVGEKPVVLALGLDDDSYRRAVELAPDMRLRRVSAADFAGSDLENLAEPVAMVLTSIDALNTLDSNPLSNVHQADALAGFVARGGGLFVTGDGAKYVAPEHMSVYVRQMLPVILQKEGKQPPPDDPTVVEEPIKVEVAKVSLCFVLDRSASMSSRIGTNGPTRWSVAAKGISESLKLVDNGGRKDAKDRSSEAVATRVGVMTFTLQQNWVYTMKPAYAGDRDQIAKDLNRQGEELLQLQREDFDPQGYNTDIYAAMDAAIDTMKDEQSAVKMIVMLTDGADRDANTQAGKRHSDLRRRALANQINIITIGIGDGFDGRATEGLAARKVVEDIATKPGYVFIAADEETAKKANVIFVDSVDLAFEAYDDKKKREEEERRRKLEEENSHGKEPPKVDVMPGSFALQLAPVGEVLFGADSLPNTAPKVAWVARNYARDGAAVALSAQTEEPGATPVLAFKGYGLGRVGFWGAGFDPEALGELTGWGDFPAIFAGSLRWLLPRQEPDVRLLGDATPDGIRILDPIADAVYSLRTPGGEVPLTLRDGMLVGEIPLGAAEVFEQNNGSEQPEPRSIGDIYVAEAPPIESRQFAADISQDLKPLTARRPEVTPTTREATLPILYLLTLVLLIMPIERLVRRRS